MIITRQCVDRLETRYTMLLVYLFFHLLVGPCFGMMDCLRRALICDSKQSVYCQSTSEILRGPVENGCLVTLTSLETSRIIFLSVTVYYIPPGSICVTHY